MAYQETFSIHTHGRGTVEITQQVQSIVRNSRVETGICHVFQHHTSASLLLNENADPAVRRDLETFLARLVPDGDPGFTHTDEGPDDMSAHVRNVLTTNSLTVPVTNGRCGLGTWQGIYLWEHRTSPHNRNITVTIQD
jgi:secondary thiamine-phosphate synthase enzyme